jgi:hypothetical protein
VTKKVVGLFLLLFRCAATSDNWALLVGEKPCCKRWAVVFQVIVGRDRENDLTPAPVNQLWRVVLQGHHRYEVLDGNDRQSQSQSQWILLCNPFHRRTTGTRCWTNNLRSITKGSWCNFAFGGTTGYARCWTAADAWRDHRRRHPSPTWPQKWVNRRQITHDHCSRIDLCSSASASWSDSGRFSTLGGRCKGARGLAAARAFTDALRRDHTGSELITALLRGEPWWPTDWLRGYSRVDLYLRALRIEQIFSCCERCRRITRGLWADCGRATLSAQPTLVGRVDCTTNAAGVRYAVGGVRSTYREIQSSARR